jgi:hypothetical protein
VTRLGPQTEFGASVQFTGLEPPVLLELPPLLWLEPQPAHAAINPKARTATAARTGFRIGCSDSDRSVMVEWLLCRDAPGDQPVRGIGRRLSTSDARNPERQSTERDLGPTDRAADPARCRSMTAFPPVAGR